MKKTILIEPEAGRDFTPIIGAALADPDCERMQFRNSRYDFFPERAAERYLFISNNDEGLKRVAFPLIGRKSLEIDGDGATFVFHGGIIPMAMLDSNDILLRRFTIDWEIPFHGEGEILSSTHEGVEVKISEGFNYRIEGTKLLFGESPIPFEIRNILEFDPEKRETAFLVHENFGIGKRCESTETGPRRVFLKASFSEPLPTPGNILAIVSDRRDFPAIVASDSSDIQVEEVTIHHAGGMGFIAQHCRNVAIHCLRVTPPETGERIISTNADATHFVNCGGLIEMTGCLFENQMDDPTNIHGLYAQISDLTASGEIEIRLRHHQQFGVDLAEVGDTVEFVDHETLATYHTAHVTSVTRLNKEFSRISVDPQPSHPPRQGDAIGNLSWSADVEIRNCLSRGNRARGFLISTPGKVVIEQNTFHTPGPAVLIEGDANFWFESGAVGDVLVSKNRFENCNYGIWGKAAIQVSPGVPAEHQATSRYHRNIRIKDNVFVAFDHRIVRARCVDGLELRGNRITLSDAYPRQHTEAPWFDTESCSGVILEDNTLSGEVTQQDRSLTSIPSL